MSHAFTTLSLSIFAALGLAAATGFRVFVPLFVASLASRAGLVQLSAGFAWMGTTPALVCFGAATLIEIAAYGVPVVDNVLDAIATPAAVVAGVLVSAAVLAHVDPWLKWTLATIAGGGLAAAVQLPTVAARGVSTGATGGLANPLVSAAELAASSSLSALAILLPILVPTAVLIAVWFVARRLARRPPRTAVIGVGEGSFAAPPVESQGRCKGADRRGACAGADAPARADGVSSAAP